jgi:hypothetical protein
MIIPPLLVLFPLSSSTAYLKQANSDQKVTEPLLSFPSLQRSNKRDRQWPLLPPGATLTGQESWRFSDAPSTATEAENAWAKKYPASVRDMAKRKLFRSQAVFRPPPEPKRTKK